MWTLLGVKADLSPCARPSRPPSAAEFCAKSSWTAPRRSPRDFEGKNISGSPQYIKKAPRRSIVGGGGHPGGRASPTAWGLQQLVMENHSAIRGLKISHRGACALPVEWQECRRGEAGRAARPTRRSCGRGARVLPGQPGPQRLRSAFIAPDPAPNDERMAA